jgi:hypothetical protein
MISNFGFPYVDSQQEKLKRVRLFLYNIPKGSNLSQIIIID